MRLAWTNFVAIHESAAYLQMADGKRKLRDADSSSEDDGCDLLRGLDDARLRELHQCNQKRCLAVREQARDAGGTVDADRVNFSGISSVQAGPGSAANDDPTAAQIFAAAWRECWTGLQRARAAQQASDTTVADEAVMTQNGGDTTDGGGDLLAFLDVERKRELTRNRVRRFRERKKQAATRVQNNEGDPNVRPQPNNERDKVLQRDRQRQYVARTRQSVKDTQQGDTFDNELSADERAGGLERLRKELGAQGLDECVCVSCDRLVLRQGTRRVEDTDSSYLRKMQKQLTVDTTDIPAKLVDMYRPPTNLTMLAGASISHRGIQSYTDDDSSLRSWMSVCKECDRSIQQGKLPKFANGNGFFVWCLSKGLRELTIPQRLMTQLVHIAATTRVMRGGRHRCIRSHCIAYDCTPAPPVCLLPRSMNDVVSYRVVLVGVFTSPQAAQVRKMHRIRKQQVHDVFAFYKQYHHLYAGVAVNESALYSEYTDDDVERTFLEHVSDPERNLDDAMNREQESIRGESDAWRLTHPQDECSVIERRLGLAIDEALIAVEEHFVTSTVSTEREFEIRRSNQIANDVSETLLARMFPHLFPFGRGHPGEDRKIHVSVEECVKHYTLLSERRFAEDELFSLVAFDRISLRNMYIRNHIRCQRFPHLFEGYENLNAERLRRALLQNERRRQGCLPWRPADDTVAERFLKSVEVGSRSIWVGNAERAQCRHKAFAYQARFGQPALFVTPTPNTDNSQVLAQYTGISSVSTLFDELGARLPSKADLREASRGNDCASARLFMRHVDVFIRCALGMDPVTRKRLYFRGLFGDVKTYFGMVETQGRGTLHIHFLIWLNKYPSNSTSVENILRSPEGNLFRDRVASYAKV